MWGLCRILNIYRRRTSAVLDPGRRGDSVGTSSGNPTALRESALGTSGFHRMSIESGSYGQMTWVIFTVGEAAIYSYF